MMFLQTRHTADPQTLELLEVSRTLTSSSLSPNIFQSTLLSNTCSSLNFFLKLETFCTHTTKSNRRKFSLVYLDFSVLVSRRYDNSYLLDIQHLIRCLNVLEIFFLMFSNALVLISFASQRICCLLSYDLSIMRSLFNLYKGLVRRDNLLKGWRHQVCSLDL